MDGCFDMMHYGHCNALRQACAVGDELVVGVISDDEIIANKGHPVTPLQERAIRGDLPIMNLHERSLSVLACHYVDEVIIGAPWEISKDMITTFNISLLVHGTVAESKYFLKKRNKKEENERNHYEGKTYVPGETPSLLGMLIQALQFCHSQDVLSS